MAEKQADLSAETSPLEEADRLIAGSAKMSDLKQVACGLAARHSTIMLLGETGSGKEMFARYIHQSSPRVGKPFIPVDCSSLTDTLFESELFGHVKGAFTGASRDSLGFIRAANGGTLFLDEIGELSLRLQAKLLRVIQEKRVTPVGDVVAQPVDIRIVTATHQNLADMVRKGTFRQDLFFRLNVVVLNIPPLRDRIDDIVPLAKHFLRVQGELYGETIKTLASETLPLLQVYGWPGNVRELANVMEHAHVLATTGVVEPSDLPERLRTASAPISESSDELNLRDIERYTIAKALKRANYSKTLACRLLGINIQRLNRRIAKLGIPMPD